jgi:hypothetical protein
LSELTLTDREARRLKSLEDTIRRSAGDMYDAMRAIHDEKLYRDEFSTWEAYCRSRWNMSATNAYRLIEHGRIMSLFSEDGQKVSPIGEVSEAATREVAALPDAAKVEVIKEVAAENNGKVTARAVRQKVHDREPGDESEPAGADPVKPKVIKATADLVESYVDDNGNEVPESLFPVWKQRDTYMRICDDLKTIGGEIRELGKSPAGRGCNAIAREVDEAGKALALLMPSVVSGKSWKAIGDAK